MKDQLEGQALASALAEWTEVLGPQYVVAESEALKAAETATFTTFQKIPVILRPENREQLREILLIANRRGVPVYPVSSGKNWGYGSRVPVTTGCALVELGRMKRITGFDEKLGYVRVEPGVSQSELFAFLQQQRSSLWMDATGSSPDCSLLGNAIERGFGHTPYGDHFSNVCGLEVMLANGDLVRTGFAAEGARAASVYRWGAGPSLDGMFSQSNYGIVTELAIWLMPKPEYFQAFFFQCDREDGLGPIIDALRILRLDGTLRSAVHIANDYKVLQGIQQFPAGSERPLSPQRMKELRKELKFSPWSGSGALYGTRKQVAEGRRLLKGVLAGKVDKVQFLDDRVLELASRFKGIYKMVTGLDLTRTLELVRPVYGLLKGVPTTDTLRSAYWRKPGPIPSNADPDRDGCGVLWTAPVAPMDGREAERLAKITEQTLPRYGFEPQISITLLTERALACVISITYDRAVEGEDARAIACYNDIQGQLTKEGYYSYRRSIVGMQPGGETSAQRNFLSAIKKALDPNGILAPGRYVPDIMGDSR